MKAVTGQSKKSSLSFGVFCDAILSQVATSLPVYLTVILITSRSTMSDVFLISSLTFCAGLAVSLTRAWISGSIAIQASGDLEVLHKLRHQYLGADIAKCVAFCLLIMLGFNLTTRASLGQVGIGFLVCLSACLNDYFRQLNFVARTSRRAMKIDMFFIASLLGGFALILLAGQVDYTHLASMWAMTMWLFSIIMYRAIPDSGNHMTNDAVNMRKIRTSLLFDFITGFGALQLVYVFAPLIASPIHAATLRLALIATGPSAVMAQALTVSGLTMIMSNPEGRLRRLTLAGGIIFSSTLVVCLCLLATSPRTIEMHLGGAWLSVRPLAVSMIIMSFTHGLLITTLLPMRWQGNPRLIVSSRLLSLPVTAVAPAFGLYCGGVQGCLLGLSFSNVYTWLVNGFLLHRKNLSADVAGLSEEFATDVK